MAVKFLDYTGLGYFWSKIKAWCNATFAAITHNHASSAVNTMTGYSKPSSSSSSSSSAIAASDSLNSAIGKLEAKVDSYDDSNYVHKTGDEDVAGKKFFQNAYHDRPVSDPDGEYTSSVFLRAPTFDKGDATRTAYEFVNFVILDRTGSELDWDGRLATLEYNTPATSGVHGQLKLSVYKNEHPAVVSGNNIASLYVGFDENDIPFAIAPSTSALRSVGGDIVTRNWIPNDTRIVHTTGNETISGVKIFNEFIEVHRGYTSFVALNPELTFGQNPSADKANMVRFADSAGNDYGGLQSIYRQNGETLTRISVESSGGGNGSVLEVNIPATGAPYAWCPSTPDPTSTNLNGRAFNQSGDRDILTRDWIPRDTRIVHTTGNETIAGTKMFSNPIVLDQTTLQMRVLQSDNTYRTDEIIYGNTQGAANINLAIGGKGNMIVGSGESARAQLNALLNSTSEVLHLCSDSYILFKTNCQTGIDTNEPVVLDSSNQFYGISRLGIADFELTAKGTNPSSSQWSTIAFSDSTRNLGQPHRLGALESYVDSNGQTGTVMRAYNWVADATTNAFIGVHYPKNGTAYTEAPTPATSDNSTKIATTAYVKAQRYITSSGTAANVSGTVAIANGGTGATTRLNAIKALTNENVGTNATHFLGLKSDWSKVGYVGLSDVKSVLGLGSAAYTASTAYATASHNHDSAYVRTANVDQNISGKKSFTGVVGSSGTHPVYVGCNSNITKGSNPSANSYFSILFNEKSAATAIDAKYRLGAIEFCKHSTNSCYSTWLIYENTANSTTTHGAVVGYNASKSWEFRPTDNNFLPLGTGSYKWTQLYANTATISTSDERLKNSIANIPDEILNIWEYVDFNQFKFNDAVEEKGSENARIHSGVIAQQIKTLFEENNIDVNKYAFFCYDSWEELPEEKDDVDNTVMAYRAAGDAYAIRYEELLCVEAAYQRRKNKILENHISELERQVSDMLQILQSLKGAN